MAEIPQKSVYRIGEVCEYTDTQPYVLRFWESEFPQLAPRKNSAGQRIYRREDVDLILRIKELLYDEEYTIAGARKRLEEDGRRRSGSKKRGRASSRTKKTSSAGRMRPAVEPEPVGKEAYQPTPESVDRARYEDAVQEIQRLRRENAQLAEDNADGARIRELEDALEGERERALRVADRLEDLIDRMIGRGSDA